MGVVEQQVVGVPVIQLVFILNFCSGAPYINDCPMAYQRKFHRYYHSCVPCTLKVVDMLATGEFKLTKEFKCFPLQ